MIYNIFCFLFIYYLQREENKTADSGYELQYKCVLLHRKTMNKTNHTGQGARPAT